MNAEIKQSKKRKPEPNGEKEYLQSESEQSDLVQKRLEVPSTIQEDGQNLQNEEVQMRNPPKMKKLKLKRQYPEDLQSDIEQSNLNHSEGESQNIQNEAELSTLTPQESDETNLKMKIKKKKIITHQLGIPDVNVKEELLSDVENELEHDSNSAQGCVLKKFLAINLKSFLTTSKVFSF